MGHAIYTIGAFHFHIQNREKRNMAIATQFSHIYHAKVALPLNTLYRCAYLATLIFRELGMEPPFALALAASAVIFSIVGRESTLKPHCRCQSAVDERTLPLPCRPSSRRRLFQYPADLPRKDVFCTFTLSARPLPSFCRPIAFDAAYAGRHTLPVLRFKAHFRHAGQILIFTSVDSQSPSSNDCLYTHRARYTPFACIHAHAFTPAIIMPARRRVIGYRIYAQLLYRRRRSINFIAPDASISFRCSFAGQRARFECQRY